MSGRVKTSDRQGRRQDRLIKERIHDPYMTRSRPREPAVCPDCGVVASGGRWQWMDELPTKADEHVCPACQRIRDRVPAGILTLSGGFLSGHHQEIMNLIDNKVAAEREQRPLKRMMSVERQDGEIVLQFTDQHLPRGVGEALASAYDGDLDIHYTEEAGLIRVYWHRD